MQEIKARYRISRKTVMVWLIALAIVAAVTAGIVILTRAYNNRLHENFKSAASVYGENGFTGDKYEFAVESVEEIKNQMSDLRKIDKTTPRSYLTYIVVEFADARYLVKYASTQTVVVIKAEIGENGEVEYGEPCEYSTDGTLPELCKALETDHGLGFVY